MSTERYCFYCGKSMKSISEYWHCDICNYEVNENDPGYGKLGPQSTVGAVPSSWTSILEARFTNWISILEAHENVEKDDKERFFVPGGHFRVISDRLKSPVKCKSICIGEEFFICSGEEFLIIDSLIPMVWVSAIKVVIDKVLLKSEGKPTIECPVCGSEELIPVAAGLAGLTGWNCERCKKFTPKEKMVSEKSDFSPPVFESPNPLLDPHRFIMRVGDYLHKVSEYVLEHLHRYDKATWRDLRSVQPPAGRLVQIKARDTTDFKGIPHTVLFASIYVNDDNTVSWVLPGGISLNDKFDVFVWRDYTSDGAPVIGTESLVKVEITGNMVESEKLEKEDEVPQQNRGHLCECYHPSCDECSGRDKIEMKNPKKRCDCSLPDCPVCAGSKALKEQYRESKAIREEEDDKG